MVRERFTLEEAEWRVSEVDSQLLRRFRSVRLGQRSRGKPDVIAKIANPVSVRQYVDHDENAVASLYSEVFGAAAMQAFLERWNWQFVNNPSNDAAESLMWVADAGSKVIGFLASFPCRFKVFDDEAVIRLPCDLMVSADGRGKGVGEQLIRAYIDAERLIPNALGYTPAAGRMYKRLGYREVDSETLRVRPCNLSALSVDALGRHARSGMPHVLVPPLMRVLGPAGNLGLKALNRWFQPARSGAFEIRRCTGADSKFDDLWAKLSPVYPVVAVRDRRWVQWRFLDDPCFEHGLFCAHDQRDAILGYIDVRVSTRRKIRFGRILDLFCDPGIPGLAESLLSVGIDHLESQGVDVITCLGHLPRLQRLIAKFCYLTPKRLQKPALFFWKGDTALEESVFNAGHWHLTHADGDDGFSP